MNRITKISLAGVVIVSLSMFCLYLIAFSNQILAPIAAATAVAFAVAVVAAAAVGTAVGAAAGAAVAFAVAVVAAATVVAAFATWDKDKKNFLVIPVVSLYIIFALPLLLGIVPLSKYHNQNQLERDQRIAGALQITATGKGIEILLPSEYASENSYLKKVLSLGLKEAEVEQTTVSWKDAVIPCREGENQWYKVKLVLPEKENSTDELVFSFKHSWKDFQTTKIVPLISQ